MKAIKKILMEMIPIILGILIALFINDWKQAVDDKKFLSRVYASVEKEMELNLKEFTTVLPKQHAVVDSLNLYMNNQNLSIVDIIMNADGLQVPTIKNTAWKSFLNSKLGLVDFEVVSTLTNIEEGKQFMNVKLDKLLDYALKNSEARDSTSKKVLVIQILNIIESEERLVETYKEYLEVEKSKKRH